ncbi:hypothetical protein HII36_52755 [Nonomuraea sp. NN258]|uniref:hypothetical protein n=1 Tax=Nonomuraea antri TaxID=2730852 RepID=UPI001568C29C|nr:hypothetical protein [Nonomuraea antri]NRQ40434.1 hypothetical protein [Nonomuraea antri]
MIVTPAHLRTLAGRAEALAAEVWALPDTTPDDSPERAPVAAARHSADLLAQGAESLRRAAADLAAVQVEPCGMPWRVCPEHGNTLDSQAGVSTCRVCRRTWSYDRADRPCQEPVTWKVIDRAGTETKMCDGHVLGARAAVAGATFIRLDPAPA